MPATNPAMPPLVQATGLGKRYGDFVAVDGIDFAVQLGECFGFLGPNGAGKSSTMRMLYCASPLSSGALTIAGLDVTSHPREVKALVGVVPQESNLDPDLTVQQNLHVYARYFDIPGRTARSRSAELLELFQLGEKAGAPVDTLSGGMKRRLIIARALLNEPKLLILDEPTTGLDPQARQLVWQKLRQLKARGTTMILTTHYMDEAAQLCDRLVVMDKGHILTEGRPAELVAEHVGREVLELEAESDPEALVAEVAGWGAEFDVAGPVIHVYGRTHLPDPETAVRRLIRRPATLEDVFLRLAGRDLSE